MKMSKKEKTVLTKTQKRSLFRWFLNGGASLNYERMMSMAYTYSMLPWLKENYKGNPEGLKKSVKTNLQYYKDLLTNYLYSRFLTCEFNQIFKK